MLKKIIFLTGIFISCLLVGKSQELDYQQIKSDLTKHVYVLSADSMEGRGAGSKGEQMAMRYIGKTFQEAFLTMPSGWTDFFQPFTFVAGKKSGRSVKLTIDGQNLKLDKDYFPLIISKSGRAAGNLAFVGYGITAPDLGHDDYKKIKTLTGQIAVIKTGSPDGNNPHSDFREHTDLKKKALLAAEKGAIGVIFINNEENEELPALANLRQKVEPIKVPVAYVVKESSPALLKAKKAACQLIIDLKDLSITATNVAGFIDNGAPHTVVIGAHYDHLGWGDMGGSLHKGEKAIHNGADDNASGVSMVIELAKALRADWLSNNNYLIVAFSAEELGLFGSKSFVNQLPVPVEKINFMLNFDMVGRLKEDTRSLAINASGTSPVWKSLLSSIKVDNLKIVEKESGIGPSDHTSFYLKDIPVLHFFTGTHEDYHKPTDDAEKLNYDGMVSIFKYVMALLDSVDKKGKLEFTKTKDESTDAPKFSVTLGVVPDYMFDGKGMRVDGVSSGKPAEKCGLKAGDIVIRMGEIDVTDMTSYMTALSKFKVGDKTTVVFLREKQEQTCDVTF